MEQPLAEMNELDLACRQAFHACYFDARIVIQLSLPSRFIALAFEIGLPQHLEFLHRTPYQRMLLQCRREGIWIHLLRVTEKVKPNVQIGLQLGRRLPE